MTEPLRLRAVEHDAAGATEALHAVLGTGTAISTGESLTWEQETLVDDGLTLSRLTAEGSTEVSVVRCPELVLVVVRGGEVRLTGREQSVRLAAGAVGLIPLGATVSLSWRRARLELVALSPAPVARLLGVREGEVQLRAPLLQPRSAALQTYLERSARTIAAEVLEQPEVYEHDLIRTQAIELLVAAVVEAFELVNRSEQVVDRDKQVVRRAVAHMRLHLRSPVSVPQIAEAAGVSVRGLQLVFRRQLDTTPLLHLRQLRLDAAREEMTSGRASGTTVAAVASSWGYANPARFTSHYRDAFTESPAAALARSAEAAEEPA